MSKIEECKKCGSKDLYLEPRVKGQNVMTADMIALKCQDCGAWLKWCPKNERQFYINKKQENKADIDILAMRIYEKYVAELKQQLEEKDKLLKCYQEEEKLIAEILGDKDLTLIGSRKHLENLVVELGNKIKDRDIIIKELDKKLADFDNFMKGNKFTTIEEVQNAINGKFLEMFDEKNKIWQDMVKNLTKTENERDTWQKACELACKWFKQTGFIGDQTEVDYYYQQAKKEV